MISINTQQFQCIRQYMIVRILMIVRFHRSNLKCWCGKHFFSYINRTALSRSPTTWSTTTHASVGNLAATSPPIRFRRYLAQNVKVVPERRDVYKSPPNKESVPRKHSSGTSPFPPFSSPPRQNDKLAIYPDDIKLCRQPPFRS